MLVPNINVTTIPSLDELAADPAKARELPLAVVEDLQVRCITVLNMLMARQLAARADAPTGSDPDVLLDVKEAAQRLSMSEDWVYRRRSTLPFAVRVGGDHAGGQMHCETPGAVVAGGADSGAR